MIIEILSGRNNLRKSGIIIGKKNYVSLTVLIIFLSFGCGESRKGKPSSLPDEKNGVAKIEFLSEMHNFGTLKAGEIVSFSFTFKNNGNKPYKITEIQRSCDCIQAKYPDEDVAPGKDSEIEVILNTAGEWGNLLKTLQVQTSAGEKKTLTVSAYVEDEQINNLLKKEK